MAGKKTKPKKPVKRLNFDNLKPSEVLCPVCRTIFIEPVMLPCHHAFCKQCFEGTMEKVNLVCPLCRNRVGSWLRNAKKDGKVINNELWMAIQRQYPKEIRNKYQGIDNDIEKEKPVIIVANPGDIRKEYEKERKKDFEEQKKIRDEEEKASAVLIKKLREEEEYKKLVEEEKIRLDAIIAQKLEEELNTPSTSNRQRLTKSDSAKKSGPMDRFVKTRLIDQNKTTPVKSHKNSSPDKKYFCQVPTVEQKPKNLLTDERKIICISSGDNSSDIIDQECKFYFKPIDLQKKYHKPGKVPLKIKAKQGVMKENVLIKAPSGKKPYIGHKLSAFAWYFSNVETEKDIIEEELPSTSQDIVQKTPKRKSTSIDNSKPPKKRQRLLYGGKTNLQLSSESKSSPFYGLENSKRLVSTSSFFGFDTLEVKESEKEVNALNKIISKCEKPKNLKQNIELIGSIPKITKKSNLKSDESKLMELDNVSKRSKTDFIDINRNIPKSNNNASLINKSAQIGNRALATSSKNMQSNSINGEIHSPESPVIGNFIGKKILEFNANTKLEETILFDTPPVDFNSSDSEEDISLSKLIDTIYKTKSCNHSPSKSPKKSPNKVPLSEASTSKLCKNLDIEPTKAVDINKQPDRLNKSLQVNEIIMSPRTRNSSTKIADSFFKTKSSPSKSKGKRQETAEEKERKRQEKSDYELAKKLQAEFDRIHVSSTTRRGTKRQATLDEMLTV